MSVSVNVNRLFLSSAVVGAAMMGGGSFGEVIDIIDCRPGMRRTVTIRDGQETVICRDPHMPGGGTRGGSTPPAPQDGDNGPRDQDDPNDEEDMSCESCRAEGEACIASALVAESICRANAQAITEHRCNPNRTDGGPRNTGGPHATSTPWGRPITDHGSGFRTGERDWDKSDAWSLDGRYIRFPLTGGKTIWVGPGRGTCTRAWAVSHPTVTTSDTTEISAQVEFAPFKIGAAGKFSVSTSWSASTGWVAGCNNLVDQYVGACTAAEVQCATIERCRKYERD